MKEKNRMKTK